MQRFQQLPRLHWRLAGAGKPAGIGGDVLDLLRQRTDQRDAAHRHDLADLMDAEFRLAAGDQIGDIAAALELRLLPDLAGDTHLLEQLVEIDAARSPLAGSI